MTPQQHNLYHFIVAQIDATGVCPTYAEMARAIGMASKSGPYRIVDALVRDGYLKRGHRGCYRTIKVAGASLRSVPTSALIAELERRGVSLG